MAPCIELQPPVPFDPHDRMPCARPTANGWVVLPIGTQNIELTAKIPPSSAFSSSSARDAARVSGGHRRRKGSGGASAVTRTEEGSEHSPPYGECSGSGPIKLVSNRRLNLLSTPRNTRIATRVVSGSSNLGSSESKLALLCPVVIAIAELLRWRAGAWRNCAPKAIPTPARA